MQGRIRGESRANSSDWMGEDEEKSTEINRIGFVEAEFRRFEIWVAGISPLSPATKEIYAGVCVYKLLN